MTTLDRPTELNAANDDASSLTATQLETWASAFVSDPRNTLMQNAVSKTTVDDVALNRSVVTGFDHSFSVKLDKWGVTNQKRSGRCWMFAGLNLLRVGAMEKMNLDSFEFSQNYTLFWDKLERSNYFLEQMIRLADRDVDDRTVAHLLSDPLGDGGQWNMFVNIVVKHGLVPKAAMPETESSSNTPRMNFILFELLREGAATLRSLAASGESVEAQRAAKQTILADIHRVLCIHLGTPPREFNWQWQDKDKAFHRDGIMTPQSFAAKYVTLPIEEYVCLVNDPRPSSPFNATYTVEGLGNVMDGTPVKYLNVEMSVLKDITKRILKDGEPVWFGCDVGKKMQRTEGLWDTNLFAYEDVYQVSFKHDKAQRLLHRQTLMTHAMLFTGVDLDEADEPRRWRVENSWGDENGQKGYYNMNDNWFDEYMFEIAAPKKYLSDAMLKALDTEPTVLPAWDPMGSLA